MPDSSPHISLDELRVLFDQPADKWEGEMSGFWLAAHTASDGSRDRMFDWMEDVARNLFEQLEIERQERADFEASQAKLLEQLEALRASVEIVQSERDEAVGKLRSLGLAVVDAMCDQSSTCRATEHKPWCFGYQPAYGIGGNLPGAESTPASDPKWISPVQKVIELQEQLEARDRLVDAARVILTLADDERDELAVEVSKYLGPWADLVEAVHAVSNPATEPKEDA